MANFNAIICARHHLGTDIRRGCLYVSSQVHHCVTKGAHIAGVFADRVRCIAVDEQYRMRIDALKSAIAADRAAGLTPFMVCDARAAVFGDICALIGSR
jgi:aromatic-L-amino-acid decarboxylase